MDKYWKTERQICELVRVLVFDPQKRVVVCCLSAENGERLIAEVRKRLAAFGIVNAQIDLNVMENKQL